MCTCVTFDHRLLLCMVNMWTILMHTDTALMLKHTAYILSMLKVRTYTHMPVSSNMCIQLHQLLSRAQYEY